MYAIIQSGGKQYRVSKNDVILVDLLSGLEVGAQIEFDQVLLVQNGETANVGGPFISGCLVKGEFLEEVKGPKQIGLKYKRRKQLRRKFGHRARHSRVKITDIVSSKETRKHGA